MRRTQREKVRHSALAQSDAPEEESIEVPSGCEPGQEHKLQRQATPRNKRWLVPCLDARDQEWAISANGSNSPGCCLITVAGQQLLLASNRQVLSTSLVNPLPALEGADENNKSAVDRHELSVVSQVAAAGHDISCFVKDPSTDTVYSGSYAGEVIRWNVKSKAKIMVLRRGPDQRAHEGGVKALCVIGSHFVGNRIATAGVDGAIRLWDIDDGTLRLELTCPEDRPAHKGGVGALSVVRNSQIASGGKDGVIRLWNTASGELLRELRRAGGDDGAEGIGLLAHDGGVQALRLLTFNFNRGLLASGGKDGAVLLWSLLDGTVQQELRRVGGDDEAEGTDRPAHDRGIRSICECRDGLIATGADDGAVRVWSMDGKLCRELKRPGGHDEAKDARLRAHDGWVWNVCELNYQVIASAGSDEQLRAWNPNTGELLPRLPDYSASASCTVPRMLVRGNRDGAIKLLCMTAPGASLRQLLMPLHRGPSEETEWQAHDGPVWTVCALSHHLIASGGQDQAIRLWNTKTDDETDDENKNQKQTTPQLKRELKRSGGKRAHDKAVKVLCMLSDHLIASGGQDGAVRLWNTDDGTLWQELRRAGGKDGAEGTDRPAHDRNVVAICGVRDGLVATSGRDGAIRMWSTADGTLQREMRRAGPPGGDDLPACDGWVHCLCCVKDDLIASAGQDGKVGSVHAAGVVRLWNTDDGTLSRELRRAGSKDEADQPAHQNSARALCVIRKQGIGRSRYRDVLVTGGDDSAIRLWNVDDGTLLHELVERVLVSRLWELDDVLYCQDAGVVRALPTKQLESSIYFNLSIPIADLADSFDKFAAVTKPKIQFGLRIIDLVLAPVQVVGFCITKGTASIVPDHVGKSFKFAKDLGFTRFSVAVSFESVYYCTVAMSMMFTFIMFYQEHLEHAVFLRPRSSARYWWLLAKLYVEATATALFVSIFSTLLRGLDCTKLDGDDTWSFEGIWSFDAFEDDNFYYNDTSSGSSFGLEIVDVGLECFGFEHMAKFFVPSCISLLAFGYLSLRLLICGADLSALEMRMTNPFDCSKDSKLTSEPYVHELSIKCKDFRVALIVLKMCLATALVLAARYPVVYSATLLGSTVVTLCVLIHSPPYYSSKSNFVQRVLHSCCVTCALAEFTATMYRRSQSTTEPLW